MHKIKKLLGDRELMLELVRYLIAGVLTTVLSLAIKYGCYMLLSESHTINGANAAQLLVGNIISWIFAVVFAFWINRSMVFRIKGGTRGSKTREFLEFVGARAVSLVIIELGCAELLKWMGVSNFWNGLIIMVLVTIFNYVASKFWIFKPKSAANGETGAAGK